MNLITIEQARSHCKVDSGEDADLTLYFNAAEAACARLANRNLYATQEALDAAIAAIPTAMTAAFAAHTAAMDAAALIEDANDRATAEFIADHALLKTRIAQDDVLYGIVAGDDILAAVLLTGGHFYRNREDVVTGQGAAAVELPVGATRLMNHHRKVGPL